MKKIKSMILLTVAVVATSLLFTGCANVSTNQKIATLSKAAAYDGTYLFLKEHPEVRPQFEQAVTELEALETADTVDGNTLLGIVSRLPVKELHSDAAVLIIGNATLLLSDFTTTLPVDKLSELKPIVTAIRQGVEQGLGPVPSPAVATKLRADTVTKSLANPVPVPGGAK